jgi:hypothetical protein
MGSTLIEVHLPVRSPSVGKINIADRSNAEMWFGKIYQNKGATNFCNEKKIFWPHLHEYNSSAWLYLHLLSFIVLGDAIKNNKD